MGTQWRQMAGSRAVLNISFMLSSKEALPGGTTQREICSFSRALFYYLSKSSVIESPLQVPQWKGIPVLRALLNISFRDPRKGDLPSSSTVRAPIERDTPFPETSFICPESLVNEPPSRFPKGASTEICTSL